MGQIYSRSVGLVIRRKLLKSECARILARDDLPKWRLAQSCRSQPQAGLKGSPSLGFAVREEDVGCLVAFPAFPGEACAKSNLI